MGSRRRRGSAGAPRRGRGRHRWVFDSSLSSDSLFSLSLFSFAQQERSSALFRVASCARRERDRSLLQPQWGTGREKRGDLERPALLVAVRFDAPPSRAPRKKIIDDAHSFFFSPHRLEQVGGRRWRRLLSSKAFDWKKGALVYCPISQLQIPTMPVPLRIAAAAPGPSAGAAMRKCSVNAAAAMPMSTPPPPLLRSAVFRRRALPPPWRRPEIRIATLRVPTRRLLRPQASEGGSDTVDRGKERNRRKHE